MSEELLCPFLVEGCDEAPRFGLCRREKCAMWRKGDGWVIHTVRANGEPDTAWKNGPGYCGLAGKP